MLPENRDAAGRLDSALAEEHSPPERLSLHTITSSITRAVRNAVVPPLETLARTFTQPGVVAREYLFRDREHVTNPAKLTFWLITAFLFIYSVSRPDFQGVFDGAFLPTAWWAYLGFVTLVPAAIAQRVLFGKRTFNIVECYASGLFLFIPMVFLATVILGITNIANYFDFPWFVLSALHLVFTSWAMTQLYQDRKLSVWLRGALVYATFFLAGYGVFHGYLVYLRHILRP